jgi:hypothetical protein
MALLTSKTPVLSTRPVYYIVVFKRHAFFYQDNYDGYKKAIR